MFARKTSIAIIIAALIVPSYGYTYTLKDLGTIVEDFMGQVEQLTRKSQDTENEVQQLKKQNAELKKQQAQLKEDIDRVKEDAAKPKATVSVGQIYGVTDGAVQQKATPDSVAATVDYEKVRVRKCPSMDCDDVGLLRRGQKVHIKDVVGAWAKIGEMRYIGIKTIKISEQNR